jgi:hypothetical protein
MALRPEFVGKKKCIRKGSTYKFTGKNWATAKKWSIITAKKKTCGTMVGVRKIDGTKVLVIKKGRSYYASVPMKLQAWLR